LKPSKYDFDPLYHKAENFRTNYKHISITPPSFMKFCPVVPEICRGQVHVLKKERRKRIRIIILIIIIIIIRRNDLTSRGGDIASFQNLLISFKPIIWKLNYSHVIITFIVFVRKSSTNTYDSTFI
jgi:hypothetical protein